MPLAPKRPLAGSQRDRCQPGAVCGSFAIEPSSAAYLFMLFPPSPHPNPLLREEREFLPRPFRERVGVRVCNEFLTLSFEMIDQYASDAGGESHASRKVEELVRAVSIGVR